MQAMDASDEQLWQACRKLPSDFEPYGQRRWSGKREFRPNCATCCWFLELCRTWPDWEACANPDSPRVGLLTFWEQGCWQFEPEKKRLHMVIGSARSALMKGFEDILRGEAADFIGEEVRRVNDPSPNAEPPAPTEPVCQVSLLAVVRRLLRHTDKGFRRSDFAGMTARARNDTRRYWELARCDWARTKRERISKIRLPANMRELEGEFWGRIFTTINEAFKER
jgi:hypothetical protein